MAWGIIERMKIGDLIKVRVTRKEGPRELLGTIINITKEEDVFDFGSDFSYVYNIECAALDRGVFSVYDCDIIEVVNENR